MIVATNFNPGVIFKNENGEIVQVITCQHHRKSQARAVVRVKLQNMETNAIAHHKQIVARGREDYVTQTIRGNRHRTGVVRRAEDRVNSTHTRCHSWQRDRVRTRRGRRYGYILLIQKQLGCVGKAGEVANFQCY